nr:hypothetical protein [Desulfobacterales bacterium]
MELDKRNFEILNDEMIKVVRKKNPQEKFAIAFNMLSCAKKLSTTHLHSLYPGWDDKNAQHEVAKSLSHRAT